jgi:uncharacterized membrane protein
MEIFAYVLLAAVVFIPFVLFMNANERRVHEQRMKELEIERLKAAAKDAAYRVMERRR